MKIIINVIICLLLLTNLCFAERWYSVPTTHKYSKNELKKPYFHMGMNLLYGGVYYLNIEEYNTYPKYILGLRFNPEIKYFRFGSMMKVNILIEYKDFTDEETYYASRFKASSTGMFGVNMKLPSPVPLIGCFKPYFLFGGGYTFDLDYNHIFMDDNGNVYVNRLQGEGPIIGFSLGSEMELMENLLYIDLGLNYLYNFGISGEINYENVIEEEFNEIELDFYMGFTYNLF